MDWRTLGRLGTGRGTFVEVRDGSSDPRGSSERDGVPSQMSGTGQGTLREVLTGLWTLPEVQDRSGVPQ